MDMLDTQPGPRSVADPSPIPTRNDAAPKADPDRIVDCHHEDITGIIAERDFDRSARKIFNRRRYLKRHKQWRN